MESRTLSDLRAKVGITSRSSGQKELSWGAERGAVSDPFSWALSPPFNRYHKS